MNAKSLIALAALVASTGAFAQQAQSQSERDFYHFQPSSVSVGKTRAEVMAELAEARRTGELERLRSDYYGYEPVQAQQPMTRMAKRNGASAH